MALAGWRGTQTPEGPREAGVTPPASGATDRRPPLCREYRHKTNITFNDNDTVSFLEFRNFKFQPDRSSGLESDYIVMPNILVLVRPPVLVPVPRPRGPLARQPAAHGPHS